MNDLKKQQLKKIVESVGKLIDADPEEIKKIITIYENLENELDVVNSLMMEAYKLVGLTPELLNYSFELIRNFVPESYSNIDEMKNAIKEKPYSMMTIYDYLKFLAEKGLSPKITKKGNSLTVYSEKNDAPPFIINDISEFEKVLKEYIETIYEIKINATKMDKEHDEEYFLTSALWGNATVYDFANAERHVRKYISFIKDGVFSEYDSLTTIGSINENSIGIQRCEAYNGYETPYAIKIILTNNDDNHRFELPTVRYGIDKDEEGKKTAYIYALQGPREPVKTEYDNQMDKMIKQINSGVKKNRNVSPSAIVSLAVFVGMLQKQGITDIKVPDFLWARWQGKMSDNRITKEELEQLKYNLTTRFLTNFYRFENHFENFNILYRENEIDSFLHISIPQELKCDNKILLEAYQSGLGKNAETDEIINGAKTETPQQKH